MICIFQDKSYWFFLPVASDAEVEPILGRSVEINVSISFNFYGEGVGGGQGGGCDIAAWEAAVDEYGIRQVDIGAIGVPDRLLMFVIELCSHRL